MPPVETQSAFARVLNKIIGEGRFTPEELADEAGCSARQIYYVQTGERSLRVDQAERIARYLCRHGETRLSAQFLCPAYTILRRPEGSADGCVKEEVIELVHAASSIDTAHSERDPDALDAAITQVRAALANLEAERDALS